MTTAHEKCPVTDDKVEDVSKKCDAVLSNSVCKAPKAFFKHKFDVLSQFRSAQKNQIKGLLIHMNTSVYGIMWSPLHGREAKLFGTYFYIYTYNIFKTLTCPSVTSEISL